MTQQKSILGLELPTDPRWADIAGKNLEAILTDHAYCEQKAATTCISLIIQYPQKTKIVEALSPIVTEEWGHFRMVLKEMKKRGISLGKQRKDEYVLELMKHMKKGGNPDFQLADRLLISALIEARSCERFKMLSEKLPEPELKKFYYDLMVSEAGHYRLFLDLAKTVLPEEQISKRWQEWLKIEAGIIKNLEVRDDRMH